MTLKANRRLDFIRFLGLEHNAVYKEWHARLEVKDSGTAILQGVLAKAGRKPHLLDPKSRSYSFKVLEVNRGTGPEHQGAFVRLEISDSGVQRIGLGQVMLRDAVNPEWRHYEAPESDERFDPAQYP